MDPPGNATSSDGAVSKAHRKRISRKEQKARKKRKRQPQTSSQPEIQPATAIYVPTPLPDEAAIQAKHKKKAKSLGNWFPKASVIKSPVSYTNADNFDGQPFQPKASLILFYQYVEPLWPESKLDTLIAYLSKIAEHRVLGGRIRVAREGVNATISSVDTLECSAQQSLEFFCKDLQHFDKAFEQTDFKSVDNLSPDRHFGQLKIFPVQELVFYGLQGDDLQLADGGVHLPPKDFHEMLSHGKDDTVVIDVRNHYEAAIGRFDGQQHKPDKGGATYIDPKMRKSTDFAAWLEQEETKQQLQGKNVMMFCTGGVRCERASICLKKKMGEEVKGVFQLQGGIEAYMKEFQDGGHWRGKNFVFDKREAVSVDDPNGDGGVLKKPLANDGAPVDDHARCCLCSKPWDRYMGKKKCSTCGVPVLMCDGCMSQKSKTEKLLRCPLCVEQGVTVRASEVELTDNGIKGRAPEQKEGKAAPSVLKWGGGHAANKKNKRKFAAVPCSFGTDCRRPDCFFAHPTK